ncbi:PQ loop repeat-domain-containing protein [Blastocladiella britannica]|nr:PQ loop repeat-domain-containing protein [Blastocladiella britannica]
MDESLDGSFPLPFDPVRCEPGYAHVVYLLFGECAYTLPDAASIVLGYASIAFWLFAQMPQVYSNWRRGSADSLSLGFVFIWLLGDLSNLVGCILTNQLPFQKMLAGYFVFVDFSLSAQTFWYSVLCRRAPDDEVSIPSPSMAPAQPPLSSYGTMSDAPPPMSRRPSALATTSNTILASSSNRVGASSALAAAFVKSHAPLAIAVLGLLVSPASATSSAEASPVTPGAPGQSTPLAYTIGVVFSYMCTALYLSSRIPQIRHNAARRSVHGLAVSMFLFAVAGNATYAMSVVLRAVSQPSPRDFLVQAFPFLLGSAGTLVQDGVIFIQWAMWKDNLPREACSIFDPDTVSTLAVPGVTHHHHQQHARCASEPVPPTMRPLSRATSHESIVSLDGASLSRGEKPVDTRPLLR